MCCWLELLAHVTTLDARLQKLLLSRSDRPLMLSFANSNALASASRNACFPRNLAFGGATIGALTLLLHLADLASDHPHQKLYLSANCSTRAPFRALIVFSAPKPVARDK